MDIAKKPRSRLRRTILDLFTRSDLHGYEVKKRLELEGMNVDIGRIYTILNEFNTEGLLSDRWEKSTTGPNRRIYSLDEKGKEEIKTNLHTAINIVHKHYTDYIIGLYPKVNLLGDLLNLLTRGLEGKTNIGFFTPKRYPTLDMWVSGLQKKMPEGRFNLIKPRDIDVKLAKENTDILSGSYNDFPLKDDFADLLIVVDLPDEKQLTSSIKEWHRVLSPNGNLGIITPSVLVKKHVDPMDIGDFVEKHEHEILGQSNHIDSEILQNELGQYFLRVEENLIVHMTLMMAFEPKKIKKT